MRFILRQFFFSIIILISLVKSSYSIDKQFNYSTVSIGHSIDKQLEFSIGIGSIAKDSSYFNFPDSTITVGVRILFIYDYKGNIKNKYKNFDIDNSKWWDWGDVELKGNYYDEEIAFGLDMSFSFLSQELVLGTFLRTHQNYEIYWDTTLNKYWGYKNSSRFWKLHFLAGMAFKVGENKVNRIYINWDSWRSFNFSYSWYLRRI